MAKYRIGVTEAGDAGIDLGWVQKMDSVDGAVVITKQITPSFLDSVLEHQAKLIVHATITGYGGSVLEPCVPTPDEQFEAIQALVDSGFPKKRLVVRVDPLIPTDKGLNRALRIIETCMDSGFSRYRVSVIDMYRHVRDRFRAIGLPLPYGENQFASREQMADADEMLREAVAYWQSIGRQSGELRMESCAEPYLRYPIHCGCVSAYDLELLGLDTDDVDSVGFQREHCMCYSGKVELLSRKRRCRHGCLYCYWR